MARRKKKQQPLAVTTAIAVDSAAPSPGEQAQSRPWLARSWFLLFWIVLIVVVGYGRTLHYPLVFDDRVYLEDNPLIKDSRSFAYPAHFVEFANKAASKGLDPDLSASMILRPVTYLTFHINYIFDGFRPFWYRVVNMLIHIINGMLVYALAKLLLKRAPTRPGVKPLNIPFIAGACALLFVAHPLAIESVTYIVQRFTSLATLFYLLVLLTHFLANTSEDKFQQRLWRCLSFLLCLVGMVTKESVFTVPVMAVMLDIIVHQSAWRTALKRGWLLIATMPILPALVMLTTWAQHQGTLTAHDVFHLANVKDLNNPQLEYAITQITVVLHYLRLIFWPTGLTIDPEWDRYGSILEMPVLQALLIMGSLIFGAAWWARKKNQGGDPRVRIALAGVLWYFITIAPSSSLFPLPDLVAEHRCFLPSIGILFAVTAALDWIQKQLIAEDQLEWISYPVAFVFIAGFAVATTERNEIWSSRVSLWEDAANKSPNKYRVWGNLGAAYAGAGELEKATACYQNAIKIEKGFLLGYIHLGTLYYNLKQPEKTLAICIEATKVNPAFNGDMHIRYNAGIAHLALGHFEKGETLLKEISEQCPDHQETQITLAKYYQFRRDPVKARIHLSKAAMIAPLSAGDANLLNAWTSIAEQTVSR